MISRLPLVMIGLWAVACLGLIGCRTGAGDSAAAKTLFAEPTRDYSSGPLWVWNDWITDEQVVSTLHDLADQHVRQVWVHPRPGLMTPYLSDEWFRLWELALTEAKKLDMNVWIYDENSYPSGFAGGLVPEAMPESRGLGLVISEKKEPPAWAEDTLAVYRIEEGKVENVSTQIRQGNVKGEGKYVLCRIAQAPVRAWHGGKYYVDLLRPGVTEKFIEITLEAYRKRFGDEFGKRIPGSFSDEPELRPAGGLPWTPTLPESFQKRWGYCLFDHLPSLTLPVGDYKKVRHDYYQLLLELFGERWGKPMHDYCEKHGLAFTGHYWEHEWPNCLLVPDNMAAYTWHQVPAIDCLFNIYREDVHAQFGNVRAVRELGSVANQLGRERTLCEAYGASGWDLRFEDMKRIGDWLYVLGVNTLNQHISNMSIRGARKYDHPPLFSYQEPWWDAYHTQADYFARLSAAMSRGKQVNPVLVLEPTTTAWLYQADAGQKPHLDTIGNRFQEIVVLLDRHQVEYDLGSEGILARFGSVWGDKFVVGQRSYSVVVLPPLMETLNSPSVCLLRKFIAGGGKVLSCGPVPQMIDGTTPADPADLLPSDAVCTVEAADLPGKLHSLTSAGFAITRADQDKGILFHHRRQLADGELLFLVNTSIDAPSTGTFEATGRGVEQWDPFTGKTEAYSFAATPTGVRADFELPPCGSLLLFVAKKSLPSAPKLVEQVETIQPVAAPVVHRDQPNVLVLDYVDIKAGDQNKTNLPTYEASSLPFKAYGLEGNPWDRSVQLRDTWITHKFPADSFLEVTYRFTLAGAVPPDLGIVIERPDLYAVTCNGQPVAPQPGAWWVDKSFGCIALASVAKVGENSVTLKASPLTVFHEVQSAYLRGDFTLQAVDKGFVAVANSKLGLGPWNEQGHPLYGEAVTYSERFQVAQPVGQYRVALPRWYGSVARVAVNGKPAGDIGYQPWQLDVTPLIKTGNNEIAVTVIGTMRNTFGPHNGKMPFGLTGPMHFAHAPNPGPPPGSEYANIAYGLHEPFVLQQVRTAKSSE